MRLNKKTIKHTCLGCLHAIAICLPILACVFRLGYAWFNKNAKDSYSDYVDTKTTQVSLSETLIEGQVYTVNITNTNLVDACTYGVLDYQTNVTNIYDPNVTWKVTQIKFYMSAGRTRLILVDENNTSHNYYNITQNFYFVSNGVNTTLSTISWYTLSTLSYTTGTLDNAFYYSTQQTLKDFHYYSENMSVDYSTYVSNLQSYFVVNVDYLSLFGVNPSSDYLYYVAINFMLNYLVTIELVLLAPEILLVFFELIRKLMFGLLDKTDERSY